MAAHRVTRRIGYDAGMEEALVAAGSASACGCCWSKFRWLQSCEEMNAERKINAAANSDDQKKSVIAIRIPQSLHKMTRAS